MKRWKHLKPEGPLFEIIFSIFFIHTKQLFLVFLQDE